MLKRFVLLLCLVVPMFYAGAFAQVVEHFDYNRLTDATHWQGDVNKFFVNQWHQLQSITSVADTAYLATVSTVNAEAEWNIQMRISTRPSAYNYSRFYLCSSEINPLEAEAYYVQAGGAKRTISLCYQNAGDRQVLIESEADLLGQDDNRVNIKVTLDERGMFSLWVQFATEWLLIGNAESNKLINSRYCSVMYRCSKANGRLFYFDDIVVSGKSVSVNFETKRQAAVMINEIMFEPEKGGQEFVELVNTSDEKVNLSGLSLYSRSKQGNLTAIFHCPAITMQAGEYVAFVGDAEALREWYGLADEQNVVPVKWRAGLNNDGSTLLLISQNGDIADSVSYSPSMHSLLLESTKGISLEKINPLADGNNSKYWKSAAKEVGYATPATVNSQYVADYEYMPEDFVTDGSLVAVQLSSKSFSPNGDGFEDECFITYHLPHPAFVGNYTVFTPSGVQVYAHHDNELLATDGSMVWSGITQSGNIVPVGIYVIQVVLTNTDTGGIIKRKLTVSVSAR